MHGITRLKRCCIDLFSFQSSLNLFLQRVDWSEPDAAERWSKEQDEIVAEMNGQNAHWFVSLSDESELEPSLVHNQPADDAEPPAIADSDLRLLCDPNFGLNVEPVVIAEGACGSEDVPFGFVPSSGPLRKLY